MQPPRLLALGDTPGLELGAVRQLQALQELAAEPRHQFDQALGRQAVETVGSRSLRREEIDLDPGMVEPNGFAVGPDARTPGFVD